MLLEINNPNPVPSKDLEANFVKSLGRISLSIPCPVSLMLTTTKVVPDMSLSLFIMISIEPFSVNLTELLRRLKNDLSNSVLISKHENIFWFVTNSQIFKLLRITA